MPAFTAHFVGRLSGGRQASNVCVSQASDGHRQTTLHKAPRCSAAISDGAGSRADVDDSSSSTVFNPPANPALWECWRVFGSQHDAPLWAPAQMEPAWQARRAVLLIHWVTFCRALKQVLLRISRLAETFALRWMGPSEARQVVINFKECLTPARSCPQHLAIAALATLRRHTRSNISKYVTLARAGCKSA